MVRTRSFPVGAVDSNSANVPITMHLTNYFLLLEMKMEAAAKDSKRTMLHLHHSGQEMAPVGYICGVKTATCSGTVRL